MLSENNSATFYMKRARFYAANHLFFIVKSKFLSHYGTEIVAHFITFQRNML